MIRLLARAALGCVVGAAASMAPVFAANEPVPAFEGPVASVMPREVGAVVAVLEKAAPALSPEFRVQLAATVVDEGQRNDLDPLRLLAVISVESEFDPEACSSAQARGLLQIRDSTRNAMAEKEGLNSCDSDPLTNVKLGARYLGLLKRQFRGREELALMAYNAGPQRLVKAIELRTTWLLKPYVNAVNREHAELKQYWPLPTLIAQASQSRSVAE